MREILFTPQTPAGVVLSCHMQLTGAWPRLFREMVVTTPPEPLRETPTLLLAAEKDSSFTVEMQKKLAQRLDAQLRVIPRSGHDVPLDSAWRQAAAATMGFLAEHAPAQPVPSRQIVS